MTSDESPSSSEIRTGLIRGNSFSYRPIQYYVVDDLALFEHDIILNTVDNIERMTQEIIDELNEKGAIGIRGDQYRWIDGIVPYTIDPHLPNLERVHAAISHWNEQTNIWLIPRTDQHNFVTFKTGNGCLSSVGMQGDQQFIYLALGCDRGRVIHEIGHTVGLWHEQSRGDRDLYIRILWQNIQAGKEVNFNQRISDGDDIGPYDYGSIMHYPSDAFSRNHQPTIVARNNAPIGQRQGLSEGDIAAVNTMYPKPAKGKPPVQ
jgi:astacin